MKGIVMKFLNLKVFSVVLILGIGISFTFWLKENANSAERDKRELVVNNNLESAIQPRKCDSMEHQANQQPWSKLRC